MMNKLLNKFDKYHNYWRTSSHRNNWRYRHHYFWDNDLTLATLIVSIFLVILIVSIIAFYYGYTSYKINEKRKKKRKTFWIIAGGFFIFIPTLAYFFGMKIHQIYNKFISKKSQEKIFSTNSTKGNKKMDINEKENFYKNENDDDFSFDNEINKLDERIKHIKEEQENEKSIEGKKEDKNIDATVWSHDTKPILEKKDEIIELRKRIENLENSFEKFLKKIDQNDKANEENISIKKINNENPNYYEDITKKVEMNPIEVPHHNKEIEENKEILNISSNNEEIKKLILDIKLKIKSLEEKIK